MEPGRLRHSRHSPAGHVCNEASLDTPLMVVMAYGGIGGYFHDIGVEKITNSLLLLVVLVFFSYDF
jgi:hypothetical protein